MVTFRLMDGQDDPYQSNTHTPRPGHYINIILNSIWDRDLVGAVSTEVNKGDINLSNTQPKREKIAYHNSRERDNEMRANLEASKRGLVSSEREEHIS